MHGALPGLGWKSHLRENGGDLVNTVIRLVPVALVVFAVLSSAFWLLKVRRRDRPVIASDTPDDDRRRNLLKTGLGAAGVLVAGAAPALAGTKAGSTKSSSTAEGLKKLRLNGHNWDRRSSDDGLMTFGNFLDTGGTRIGSFHGVALPAASPFAGGSRIVELHTFEMEDGNLYGVGSQSDPESGTFAILGGTGAYTGATGSYLLLQSPRSLGGDGTSSFEITYGRQE
jgi:hypothetical protein